MRVLGIVVRATLGFEPESGVKSKTRLSPGRVMVCPAQGACIVRAKVRVQGYFYLGEIAVNVVVPVFYRGLYMAQDKSLHILPLLSPSVSQKPLILSCLNILGISVWCFVRRFLFYNH